VAVEFGRKDMEELHGSRVQYGYVQLCDADEILRKELSLHGDRRREDGVLGERSFDSDEVK
jgi:hypothetical protein